MTAAAPPPVARRSRRAASGALASTTSAPASAPRPQGRVVDVDGEEGGVGHRPGELQGREPDAPETDDDQRAPIDPRPDLPDRAEGGEPGAGVRAGEGHREIADREEIPGMRDEDVIAEPAGPGDAERLRLRAQMFPPRPAGAAAAAADPGIHHVPGSGVDDAGVRTARHDDAADLVSQRQRQGPPLRQVQPPPAAQVEEAVLQVQVAVADAAGLGPDEHLGPDRLRRQRLDPFQGRAEPGELMADHGRPPGFRGRPAAAAAQGPPRRRRDHHAGDAVP